MKRIKYGAVHIGYTVAAVFFSVFALSGDLYAQKGTLKGFVFDAETSEPLPFANIIIEGTSEGTYSASDGSYELSLDSGKVEIRYRFLSYSDTLIQFHIKENKEIKQNVYLEPDRASMDITVSADRVAQKVKKLAQRRDQRNSNLRSYHADIYKLAILSNVEDDFEYEQADLDELDPIAFSERKSSIAYQSSPERYSEVLEANRASENFFSEYDFFSTGGAPLNLNADEVSLSILSEDITVVGPISDRAGDFYELYDEDADSTWPAGTTEIYFEPKRNNRPLFEGKVWYNEESSAILSIDIALNDYADTFTGTFQIYNFRYQQSYKEVEDFWLPKKTELSAMLRFITSKKPIYYHDEWAWYNFRVNTTGSKPGRIQLNTAQILPDAHKKNQAFWDSLSGNQENENIELLDDASEYDEDRVLVKLGMSAFSTFSRLPYQLERFYLSNFSDLYHYNRVEGHYLGLGLKTPVHPDYQYRAIGGYGTGNESFSYHLSGYHYVNGSILAPELRLQKKTLAQYQDYEYNRRATDFFEAGLTLKALLIGNSGNNYFEREGLEAGLRLRFDAESFLRVLYLNEQHNYLTTSSDFSIFSTNAPPEDFLNNDPEYPAQEGDINGLYVHMHHDTRQYSKKQFLRDYNIRKFGWLSDFLLEKGMESWNSDFDYNRYRLALKFYWPVFSSHFFQADLIVGASDAGVPNQRMFTYNGFIVDDYVRYRPFNTLNYREPLGNRVSEVRFRYKFGSSLTRKIPIDFISKSGIQIATFFTAGVIDQNPSLEPLLPHSDSELQAELGIAANKILGIFYIEFSKRLYGEYGNEVGFKFLL